MCCWCKDEVHCIIVHLLLFCHFNLPSKKHDVFIPLRVFPNACCLQATRRQYDRDRDSATAGSEVNGYQRRKDRVPFDATEMMKKIQESFGAGSIGVLADLSCSAPCNQRSFFFSPLWDASDFLFSHFNAEGTISHLAKRSMLRPGDFTQANISRTAANMAAFDFKAPFQVFGEVFCKLEKFFYGGAKCLLRRDLLWTSWKHILLLVYLFNPFSILAFFTSGQEPPCHPRLPRVLRR